MTVAASFSLGYVPGATPAKWARRWSERLPSIPLELVPVQTAHQFDGVIGGALDAALIRIPPTASSLRRTAAWQSLSVVPLYEEAAVAVVARGHYLTAAETLALEDVSAEPLWLPLDDLLDWAAAGGTPGSLQEHHPETARAALDLVATGTGVTVLPHSLARLYSDPDLAVRPLHDGPVARVGITWLATRTTDSDPLLEEMVGIVKGRRATSSRGIGAAGSGEHATDARSRGRKDTSATARHKDGARWRKPRRRH